MTRKAQTNAVFSDELAESRIENLSMVYDKTRLYAPMGTISLENPDIGKHTVKQSKTHSAIEAITNILVGFGISILVTVAILPIWGFHPTTGQAVEISAIFSSISIIRSYILRRLFTGLF